MIEIYKEMQKLCLKEVDEISAQIKTIERCYKIYNGPLVKETRQILKEILLRLYMERDKNGEQAEFYGTLHQRTKSDKSRITWR